MVSVVFIWKRCQVKMIQSFNEANEYAVIWDRGHAKSVMNELRSISVDELYRINIKQKCICASIFMSITIIFNHLNLNYSWFSQTNCNFDTDDHIPEEHNDTDDHIRNPDLVTKWNQRLFDIWKTSHIIYWNILSHLWPDIWLINEL